MENKEIGEKLGQVAENIAVIQAATEKHDVALEKHEGLSELAKKTADDLQAVQEARQVEAGEKAQMAETLKALEAQVVRGVQGAGNDGGEQYKEYGNSFNRYLKTGEQPSQALIEDVCKGICEKTLHGASQEEINMITKTMVVGSNPRGGYFVRPEVSSRMIGRIFETSPMRSLASVMNINSDSVSLIIDDNEAADGGWVGEVDSRGNTDTPEIGELTIEAHEIFAQPKVTQKFLDDAAIDVESWLQGKVTRKMSRSENTAFVLGDGSKKPRGINDYPDRASAGTYERGAIKTLTSTNSGVLDEGNDFLLLQNSIPEEYQANANWLMKRDTFGSVITLKDSSGQYILQSRFIDEGMDRILLGRPIVFMNDLPSVAADSLSVLYGDFREGYTIVDRTGFRVIRDEVTEKPFIKFYTTKRTGGDVTSYDSFSRLRTKS